jgi:hypothetical protein
MATRFAFNDEPDERADVALQASKDLLKRLLISSDFAWSHDASLSRCSRCVPDGKAAERLRRSAASRRLVRCIGGLGGALGFVAGELAGDALKDDQTDYRVECQLCQGYRPNDPDCSPTLDVVPVSVGSEARR